MEPNQFSERNSAGFQQVRKGSTPLLLLSVLADGEMHGYQIMREMETRSAGYFTMTAALLYPTLHQMEQDGLLESRWEGEEGKRRRKIYIITARGRKALAASRADWQGFIQALNKTLEGGARVKADDTADGYLRNLRTELKGFSEEERAALLAEIEDHIASGDADPSQRAEGGMANLGSAHEMAHQFKNVYRPGRWLEFLLIFIPAYLLFPLVLPLLQRWLGPSEVWNGIVLRTDIRVVIGLGCLLALLALKQRSAVLLAYWVPDVMTRIIVLMTREQRWVVGKELVGGAMSWVESLGWYALLLGLAGWLGWFAWRNRRDVLLLLFALQPFIVTAFNVGTFAYAAAFALSPHYPSWTIRGIGIINLTQIVSLAGFCLLRQRTLRWLAFTTGLLCFATWMSAAFWPNPVLVALWGSVWLIFAGGWWLERRRSIALRV